MMSQPDVKPRKYEVHRSTAMFCAQTVRSPQTLRQCVREIWTKEGVKAFCAHAKHAAALLTILPLRRSWHGADAFARLPHKRRLFAAAPVSYLLLLQGAAFVAAEYVKTQLAR